METGELSAAVPVRRFERSGSIEDARRLSKIDAWKSARAIAFDWACIAVAATAAIEVGHWAAYLLAMIVIAARQHGLAVLMHDGAHYRLFADRATNDFLSDFLLSFPLGVSTTAYRRTHLDHHRYLNQDGDPDLAFVRANPGLWSWPKTPGRAALVFLGDLTGANALVVSNLQSRWSVMRRLRPGSDDAFAPAERWRFVAFLCVALAIATATGWWWQGVVLWLIPAVTLLPAISRLRAISEHLCTEGVGELDSTRETLAGPLERFFLAPHGIHHHLTHHLFPSTPFHALAELHGVLMRDERFREGAHLTRGYLDPRRGVVSEVVAAR